MILSERSHELFFPIVICLKTCRWLSCNVIKLSPVSLRLSSLCACSRLHRKTFPLHALPRLRNYVPCLYYAPLHRQQHTTGEVNPQNTHERSVHSQKDVVSAHLVGRLCCDCLLHNKHDIKILPPGVYAHPCRFTVIHSDLSLFSVICENAVKTHSMIKGLHL